MASANTVFTMDAKALRSLDRLASAIEESNRISKRTPQVQALQAERFGNYVDPIVQEVVVPPTEDERLRNEQDQVNANDNFMLTHNEETLHKVRRVLDNVGLSDHDIDIAINDFQNAGILFRERA